MVSNIFYFHPYLGKMPILTNIFQMGWNHQPVLKLTTKSPLKMAAKGRGSFRPIFRDEVPVSFWEGIPACTKQELLNPVNGSIATNLTLFFCEIAFLICISTWWTIKNPLQQAFSWLYPSFWSHKRQVAGHRYKRGLTQISWCLTKFRWNMVKYALMTVKSSSTEAI